MKILPLICILALFSNPAASSEYQNIIQKNFSSLKVMDKTDFNMQAINSELPPKELKKINGMFSLALNDYDGNGLMDFVALTYNKNIKPKLINKHYFRYYTLVICLKYKKYTCETITDFKGVYPSQHYLTPANLYADLECQNNYFKKGMPAFYLFPVLGNIWDWGVFYSGKVVMCSAGD